MESGFKERSTLLAAVGYSAIVLGLLYRLLLGEVLSPAANLWTEVPFRSVLESDLTPYLNGIQGDAWRACEPWHIYQYRAARNGQFPLWNPHVYCGFPFHANAQSAVLSPFHWIYFLVNPKWATGVVAASKLWVTGFATYCFGRRLAMVPLGAFLAGSAWMLCAFNVRWLLWPLATATVWLPVLLLALESLLERPSWRRLALAALAATGLELSGHPECQFLVAALTGLYVLLRVVWSATSVRDKVRRLGFALAAHVLGLLGGAAALVPFVEQMSQSVDWQESTHAMHRYLPAEGLLGAIAPDHFGRPRAGRMYHDRLHANYIEAGLYIGLLPLALAASGLVRLVLQPRRTIGEPTGQVAAVFAVWIVLCMAVVVDAPGVGFIVDQLPFFSKCDTLRLVFGVQFGGAMLAGIAWSWLSQRCSIVVWLLASWCTGIALLLAAILLMPDLPGLYSHREGLRVLWTDPSVPSPLEHRSLRTLVSFMFAILGAFWAIACIRSVRNRHSAGWESAAAGQSVPAVLRVTLLAIVLLDLGWVAYGFNPTVPPEIVFPDPPVSLRRLVDSVYDGRMIATDEILVPNLAMVYGFRDLRGYDFPIDTYWAKLFRRLGWMGEKASITLLPRDQVNPCMSSMLQSVLDKCAVRFLYTNGRRESLVTCGQDGRPAEAEPSRAWPLLQFGPGDDAVYQNPTAYARAYFPRRVSVTDLDTALAAVLDVAHDLREQSFVADLAEPPHEMDGGAVHTVTIETDGADEVVLHAQSAAAGLLVLSDRYDSGWRVEIDGRPAQPLRANCLFRGVIVPAGEHNVRWIYRPRSFTVGLIVSALSLSSMLGALLWGRSG